MDIEGSCAGEGGDREGLREVESSDEGMASSWCILQESNVNIVRTVNHRPKSRDELPSAALDTNVLHVVIIL